MAQSVYFDSQIIISVSDGVIPASAWKEVLEKLAGRYNYRVSFTTFMEIVNALAGGDDDHFGRNRKRLLVLTDVADCEFLPVPGQFIRTAVLGLPSERPQFAPEQLEKVWMPAIKQARDKNESFVRRRCGGVRAQWGRPGVRIDAPVVEERNGRREEALGGTAESCKGWQERDAARWRLCSVHFGI